MDLLKITFPSSSPLLFLKTLPILKSWHPLAISLTRRLGHHFSPCPVAITTSWLHRAYRAPLLGIAIGCDSIPSYFFTFLLILLTTPPFFNFRVSPSLLLPYKGEVQGHHNKDACPLCPVVDDFIYHLWILQCFFSFRHCPKYHKS